MTNEPTPEGIQPQTIEQYREKFKQFTEYLRSIETALDESGYGNLLILTNTLEDVAKYGKEELEYVNKSLEAPSGLGNFERIKLKRINGITFQSVKDYQDYLNNVAHLAKDRFVATRAQGQKFQLELLFTFALKPNKFDSKPLVVEEKSFTTAEQLKDSILSKANELGIIIDTSDSEDNLNYYSGIMKDPDNNEVLQTTINILLQGMDNGVD